MSSDNASKTRITIHELREWRLDPVSHYRHSRAPRHAKHVILLRDEGYQSSLAVAMLQQMGFTCAKA